VSCDLLRERGIQKKKKRTQKTTTKGINYNPPGGKNPEKNFEERCLLLFSHPFDAPGESREKLVPRKVPAATAGGGGRETVTVRKRYPPGDLEEAQKKPTNS